MTATPQLVVALDLPEKDAALTLAARLRGIVPWVKAGMELFTLCGPSVLSALKDMGFHVFLDMKFYDIPNTVAQAVRSAARSGASERRGVSRGTVPRWRMARPLPSVRDFLHYSGGEKPCQIRRRGLKKSGGLPRFMNKTSKPASAAPKATS